MGRGGRIGLRYQCLLEDGYFRLFSEHQPTAFHAESNLSLLAKINRYYNFQHLEVSSITTMPCMPPGRMCKSGWQDHISFMIKRLKRTCLGRSTMRLSWLRHRMRIPILTNFPISPRVLVNTTRIRANHTMDSCIQTGSTQLMSSSLLKPPSLSRGTKLTVSAC